jgi:two-component system, sensor histidine kinase
MNDPAAAVRPLGGLEGEPVAAARRRVLVVDDNQDSAETIAMLIELWGHEAKAVHDGAAALAAAAELRPEVILLDIGLPGIDGYEVARRLRADGLGGKLLVAMTGYGRDEDRRLAREAGFDEHLVKPVDPNVLRELLARLPG